MTHTTTPTTTYTNDGEENPYTVRRILEKASDNLLTISSVVEAVEKAVEAVAPYSPGEHFAVALEVALNSGVSYYDGIAGQSWEIRYQRGEKLRAEMMVYSNQLCPALAHAYPTI